MDRGKAENARNREGKPKTKEFICESDDKIEWADRCDARAKITMEGIAQPTEMAPILAPYPMLERFQKEIRQKLHKQKSYSEKAALLPTGVSKSKYGNGNSDITPMRNPIMVACPSVEGPMA
jgi:hypothetical protein